MTIEKNEFHQNQEYLKELQGTCEGRVGDLQKRCLEEGLPIIPSDVASLLMTLLSYKKPSTILEIGCCVGFSSLLMSQYLQEGGHITTIDRYDCMIQAAKENFRQFEAESKITLLEGDACEIVPSLTGSFDLIFLDAAKGQYLNLLPHCIRLLKKDGLFLADDVLQEGRIASGRYEIPRRQRTIHTRMRKFLDLLLHTKGLQSSILPIGDGLALCCKTDDFVQI